MANETSEASICRRFDTAVPRLLSYGIEIHSDETFVLSKNGVVIATPATVDGLICAADILDYCARKGGV